MDEILDQIKNFAEKAHGDQKRKYSPEPYIVHPVRVMNTCQAYSGDITILATALLHDVLEDTSTGKKKMKNFLIQLIDGERTEKIISMVEELTDKYTKLKYPLLNRDQRKEKEHDRLTTISPGAQTVKYADLVDNCTDITKNDPDFAPRYIKEAKDILNRLKEGEPKLRERALKTVANCELQLKSIS